MPRSPDMASLHGVHKALLNAEQAGRTGGALYVKDDACAYRAVDDFPDERFRAHLSQMIAAGGALYFFVVEERDNKLHVVAYAKEDVWAEARRAYGTGAAAGPAAASGAAETDGPVVEELHRPAQSAEEMDST